MEQVIAALQTLRQKLLVEIDEACAATSEHRRYWEQLAGREDLTAEDHETIAVERRKETLYLARAEALTLVVTRLEAILDAAGVAVPAAPDPALDRRTGEQDGTMSTS